MFSANPVADAKRRQHYIALFSQTAPFLSGRIQTFRHTDIIPLVKSFMIFSKTASDLTTLQIIRQCLLELFLHHCLLTDMRLHNTQQTDLTSATLQDWQRTQQCLFALNDTDVEQFPAAVTDQNNFERWLITNGLTNDLLRRWILLNANQLILNNLLSTLQKIFMSASGIGFCTSYHDSEIPETRERSYSDTLKAYTYTLLSYAVPANFLPEALTHAQQQPMQIKPQQLIIHTPEANQITIQLASNYRYFLTATGMQERLPAARFLITLVAEVIEQHVVVTKISTNFTNLHYLTPRQSHDNFTEILTLEKNVCHAIFELLQNM